MERLRVGIIGAGHIARKMGYTLREMEDAEPYAVASRNLENAQGFADEWGFAKAYGSYDELIDDPNVDLIYIATPHSHHYGQARMCLERGKPVLCEKAFTANAREAEALIRLSQEKQVFITEAMWTRYMPFSKTIREIVDSGMLGRVMMLTANIGYPIHWKERIAKPFRNKNALRETGVIFRQIYLSADRLFAKAYNDSNEGSAQSCPQPIHTHFAPILCPNSMSVALSPTIIERVKSRSGKSARAFNAMPILGFRSGSRSSSAVQTYIRSIRPPPRRISCNILS